MDLFVGFVLEPSFADLFFELLVEEHGMRGVRLFVEFLEHLLQRIILLFDLLPDLLDFPAVLEIYPRRLLLRQLDSLIQGSRKDIRQVDRSFLA